ncbi:hypothetical protein BCV70DRAFT_57500 [Testicularia cyperi]|uniref:Secreted protein n=1 Tax=Testicularia cyperi TaxID=1882483 RepID=A0A317XV08_9BASI|nr:hypothetical protein BCV70DRAFT_57500 [Testicularia cyperi]
MSVLLLVRSSIAAGSAAGIGQRKGELTCCASLVIACCSCLCGARACVELCQVGEGLWSTVQYSTVQYRQAEAQIAGRSGPGSNDGASVHHSRRYNEQMHTADVDIAVACQTPV